MFEFDLPKEKSSVIKVIGVGGGGSNAVNHMFEIGAKGVDFAVCNTDEQALNTSPVPNKIQLGITLTKGLGAGADPEMGEKAAKESLEEIRSFLERETEMLFITAGMGGGTGTGAAPIIARTAREMEILTVGIVTVPFTFEGRTRMRQAQKGIEQLKEYVDTLIVVNNDKIREIYGNLGFKAAFSKADEILANASKGISEVITQKCLINIDLNDARTVLKDSGTAIMGTGEANGENRAAEALKKAVHSPLLNNNHIQGAEKVLLLIMSGSEEVTFDEIGEINDLLIEEAGDPEKVDIIMGVGEDDTIGNNISVTVIATGFAEKNTIGSKPVQKKEEKIVHTLVDDVDPLDTPIVDVLPEVEEEVKQEVKDEMTTEVKKEVVETINPVEDSKTGTIEFPEEPTVVSVEKKSAIYSHTIEEVESGQGIEIEEEEVEVVEEQSVKEVEKTIEAEAPSTTDLMERAKKRRERLQKYNYKNMDANSFEQIEKEPAYKRHGIELDDTNGLNDANVSRYTLDDEDINEE
jgi:cell division protein FtsZ